MFTTSWLLSCGWGQFWPEQLNPSQEAGGVVGVYIHITAAGLFQCLIGSIMNDEEKMRLEFTVPNDHHKMAFVL